MIEKKFEFEIFSVKHKLNDNEKVNKHTLNLYQRTKELQLGGYLSCLAQVPFDFPLRAEEEVDLSTRAEIVKSELEKTIHLALTEAVKNLEFRGHTNGFKYSAESMTDYVHKWRDNGFCICDVEAKVDKFFKGIYNPQEQVV